MRTRIAVALGLAAGLIAAPALAAEQGTTTTRGVHPVPPTEGATNPAPNAAAPAETAPMAPAHPMHHVTHHVTHHVIHHPMHTAMMHHPMPMHHGMTHAAATPAEREHMTIEQLNNMSLRAAKQGQNFAPPAGK